MHFPLTLLAVVAPTLAFAQPIPLPQSWTSPTGVAARPTESTAYVDSALRLRRVSITDYLAPGSNDITQALGLAEADLGPRGGKIAFPRRTSCYMISATHQLPSNVVLEGEGRNASCILSNFQGDVIAIGDGGRVVENAGLRDIAFRSEVSRTSGAAIALRNAYNTHIADVSCDLNPHVCVDIYAGANAFKTHISRLFVPVAGYVGIRIGHGVTGTDLPAETYIETPLISAQRRAGIEISNASGLVLTNPDAFLNEVNLLITPGDQQIVRAVQTKDGFLDTAPRAGLKIAPSGTGRFTDSTFTGLWTASNGQRTGDPGVLIHGTRESVRSISFGALRSFNNGGEGVRVEGGAFIDFFAPQLAFNSQMKAGSYSGFYAGPGLSNWSITGGRSGAGSQFKGTPQKYGLEIAAGDGDYINVNGLDLTGNAAGGLSNGATGAHQSVSSQGAPFVFAGANVGIGTKEPANLATITDVSRAHTDALAGGASLQVSVGAGAATDTGIRFGALSRRYGWMQCAQPGATNLPCLINPNGGGVQLGKVPSGTSDVSGMPYVPAVPGEITAGVPPITGMAPLWVDSKNGRICTYVRESLRCVTLQ